MAIEVVVKQGKRTLTTRAFASMRAAEDFATSYRKRKIKDISVYILKDKLDTITTSKLPARQRAQSIKQGKSDKRAQFKWNLKSKAQQLAGRELSSSFVSSLDYDTETGDVDVILGNKSYRFFNVPEALFVAWTKGAATCQTDDTGKKKRWWVGKTPSLGAFFDHYIKEKYGWVRM